MLSKKIIEKSSCIKFHEHHEQLVWKPGGIYEVDDQRGDGEDEDQADLRIKFQLIVVTRKDESFKEVKQKAVLLGAMGHNNSLSSPISPKSPAKGNPWKDGAMASIISANTRQTQ